jgi:hypothetical protein
MAQVMHSMCHCCLGHFHNHAPNNNQSIMLGRRFHAAQWHGRRIHIR